MCIRPAINERNIRRMIIRVGEDNFWDLLQVKRADCLAQSDYHRDEKLKYIADMESAYKAVLEAGDCLKIRDLHITGKDLIAMGVPQGRRIGEILNALFEEVVENPTLNTAEYLHSRATQLITESSK